MKNAMTDPLRDALRSYEGQVSALRLFLFVALIVAPMIVNAVTGGQIGAWASVLGASSLGVALVALAFLAPAAACLVFGHRFHPWLGARTARRYNVDPIDVQELGSCFEGGAEYGSPLAGSWSSFRVLLWLPLPYLAAVYLFFWGVVALGMLR